MTDFSRGKRRSIISKKAWARRKREGGKGTCTFCGKPIFAGGVTYGGKMYHKGCLGFHKAGLTRKQAGVTNPRGQKGIYYYKDYFFVHDVNRGTRLIGKTGQPGFIAEVGSVGEAKKYIDRILARKTNPRRARRAWQYYPGASEMNPRPPAGWWSEMHPRTVASYPGASKERQAKITAGIWYGFPEKTRQELIRRYDNPTKCQYSTECKRKATHKIMSKYGDFYFCAKHAKLAEKIKGVRYVVKLNPRGVRLETVRSTKKASKGEKTFLTTLAIMGIIGYFAYKATKG